MGLQLDSFTDLNDGVIIADSLIYFDEFFTTLLSNIFRDFSHCEENERFHLSVGNWKTIIKAIDHYFFKNNETNFGLELEEEKLVKGDRMELFNAVIIIFSIM